MALIAKIATVALRLTQLVCEIEARGTRLLERLRTRFAAHAG